MRIASATLYALNIPFNLGIGHASKIRSASDSVVLRLETAEGRVGYGEGVPRPYVSGESVETLVAYVRDQVWPRLPGRNLGELDGEEESLLQAIEALIPDGECRDGVRANHAGRAAVELAVMDLCLKERGRSLGDVIPPTVGSVTYSGLVPFGPLPKALKIAQQEHMLGLDRLKVKVGTEDDVGRLKALRETLGDDVELYVDANCAWTFEEAVETLGQLLPFGIACAEQPIPPGRFEEMAALRKAVQVPIMVDESLVTLDDAKKLIEAEACDIFNVRLSKCGGIARSLRTVELAREAGLDYQIGAHVGETAILAAAGRHVALHTGDARWVEGSYGPLLLTEDLTDEAVVFGAGGLGGPLGGTGLGVHVLDERLRTYAVETLELTTP